jgi:hypothetical protein
MSPRTSRFAALTAAWLALPFGIATAQEPEAAPPTGQTCGGFAGLACPEGYSCADNPNDTCDPNTGADCAGTCVASDTSADREGEDTGKKPKKTKCDYNSDPNLQYVSQDPEQCAAIRFTCDTGFEPFFNDCGCGCQPIAQ